MSLSEHLWYDYFQSKHGKHLSINCKYVRSSIIWGIVKEMCTFSEHFTLKFIMSCYFFYLSQYKIASKINLYDRFYINAVPSQAWQFHTHGSECSKCCKQDKMSRKRLWQYKQVLSHLWDKHSIGVNQFMMAIRKTSKSEDFMNHSIKSLLVQKNLQRLHRFCIII